MRRVGAPEVPRGRNVPLAAPHRSATRGVVAKTLLRRALSEGAQAAPTARASNLKRGFLA